MAYLQEAQGSLNACSRPRHPEVMRLVFVCALLSLLAGHGGADTRAIGAEECRPNSQPWQAGLFYLTHLFCGASLISDRWLLTAAHCQKPVTLGAPWFAMGPWRVWCLGVLSPAPDPGARLCTPACATTWTGSERPWKTTEPSCRGRQERRVAGNFRAPASEVSARGLTCPETPS
uniref:Kallikrein related peptidase 9 n=1 Tax=Ailuropoda melanoleuca TaxID=9646 RepID=A0A7N5JGQ2_AILME